MDLSNNSFPVTVFGFPDTVVFNHRFHVLKSGLNYHFGGSGAGDEGLPWRKHSVACAQLGRIGISA